MIHGYHTIIRRKYEKKWLINRIYDVKNFFKLLEVVRVIFTRNKKKKKKKKRNRKIYSF